MVTSYVGFTAPLFEDAKIRTLLVGDTLGMVMLGREKTVSVTID